MQFEIKTFKVDVSPEIGHKLLTGRAEIFEDPQYLRVIVFNAGGAGFLLAALDLLPDFRKGYKDLVNAMARPFGIKTGKRGFADSAPARRACDRF